MTTNINPAGTSYPMASLYVGNLHPDVSEAMLFEKFSTVGPVLGIRVCRDMITRRSLGYAYVNFQMADAARAIETFNSDIIEGQQMRIMWSKKDPVTGKSGGNTIFIKNLDRSVDNKALYDTFSVLGNILSCKIVCDEHGSRGYGFVHFETAEEAKDAIEKVNGMLINGKKVSVTFETSDHKIQEDTKEKFNNLYFKNFDNLSEEKLRDVFEPFGNIISLKIMTDVYGESRGFGFVCYQNADEAQTAVEELNGALIGDNTFFVGRAQNKTERHAELKNQTRDLNVYVKNLDNNVDDDRLRKEFSQFGTITSAKVMTEGGRSKGFGFVCFRSPEDATKAVTNMNGRIIVAKPLYVALSQSKEDRKAQLASKYMQRIERIRNQVTHSFFNGHLTNTFLLEICYSYTFFGQPAAGMMSQIFPSAGPGYILPTMTQGQRNFYAPTQVPQIKASPRWPTQLRQPTSASGFQNMPGQQVRPGNPAAAGARQPGQGNIRGGMNARPITGQSGTGQPPRMPQSVPQVGTTRDVSVFI
ncbi:polyadenylate-binding protein 4-like [Mytilus edulis]|uniref:polyadenylate-binding protein 4-like n=1 Tax=Mytilus edulis TaxID=6550 RepID=UPI0039EF4777